MTRYGVPYWLARVPVAKRPSFPRWRGAGYIPLAIVGGGFTGVATAWLFARAGVRTLLLEAGRLGQGASAGTSGVVRAEPDARFAELQAAAGRRAAREIFRAWRQGATDLAAALRRERIRCELGDARAVLLAVSREDEDALGRELGARRAAGVEGSWWGSAQAERETGIAASGALRAADAGVIDPYRALLGLAASAAKRGAFVHERSEVLSVKPARDGVELKTGGGTVQAGAVVVATGTPGPLFKPLARHVAVRARYGVVTRPIDRAIRASLHGAGDVLARREPRALQLRWVGDGRLMAAGAEGAAALGAGAPAVAGRRPLVPGAAVVQRAGQLMYETSVLFPAISGVAPDYAWASRESTSRDGLFYAGPHRNYPHHLFAFGSGDGGLTSGFLAAAILLRYYLGRASKSDQLFGFGR